MSDETCYCGRETDEDGLCVGCGEVEDACDCEESDV